MNPLEPAPRLQDRGIIIGQSELLRTILLAMVIRGVIDRQLLANIIDEVLGGIKERGYDPRYLDDADRYVRDILAQLQQQLDAMERLSHENEKPN